MTAERSPDQVPPFTPGEPYCHACGEPTPLVEPSPHDRCKHCNLHLHHCRNCMFSTPTGCLLRSPFRWPTSGLPGQDCPSFLWRSDEHQPFDPQDLATWRSLTLPDTDAS